MVRKHRRRTRKRNKKGGGDESVTVIGKMKKGIIGLDNLRKQGQQGLFDGLKGAQKSIEEVERGYRNRVEQGGMLSQSPQPPSSYVNPDPINPETGIVSEIPLTSTSMDPKKEKEAGGLLGLGWFGLGGRRLSHSAFINKMLRVRNKSKRNKAIRKYLKGGKKKRKTRKKRKSKKKRRKRR